MSGETMLDRLSVAARLLAEAKTMDDIRQVRDVAEMARAYAQAAKLGREAENDASVIRVKAERRAGEVLQERLNHSGGHPVANPTPDVGLALPKLADLGVTYNESSEWQKLADIPEPEFEERVEAIRERGGRVSAPTVLREPTAANAATDDDLVFVDDRPLRKALHWALMLGGFDCYAAETVIAYVEPSETPHKLRQLQKSIDYLHELYGALESRSLGPRLEALP